MRHILLHWTRALIIAGMAALTACNPGVIDSQEKLLFQDDAQYSKWVGRPISPLKLSAIDGSEINLEQLKGRVVLIDFWATWCGPCMQKLPEIKAAYTELHSRGLEIVGISADHDVNSLKDVVAQQGIAWPQHFAGADKAALKRFEIGHYPSMWLVDQKGVIRYISAGADLKTKVLKLLNETTTAPFAGEQPKPQEAPAAFAHLKLLGVTTGHALVSTGGQSHNFAKGEAKMVKTPAGFVRLQCVALEAGTASFLVDDYPVPVALRPGGWAQNSSAGTSR